MSKRSFLYYDVWDAPIGTMTLVANKDGVCRIDFGTFKELSSHHNIWARKHFLAPEFIHDADYDYIKQMKEQLSEYFQGERTSFSVKLNCYGTPFQRKVWRILANDISYGETLSYKDIAVLLQSPKAIRAVGGAVNKNPLSIVIPCHRVIGSNGKLVGYAGGLDRKQQLIELEAPDKAI
ncbi:methylated-DNA--[protein]-cysteine S-methyltransferase [Thalassobacillus sp. CUG 92003]|uniref:methylated-DNA--[protein]-cysteine S-methyltransferase n=1 Tax=Thalassobacillus sp. CUG 92003 TaxID=2736641 RepID=UPI0015E702CB|nr:methylated-DNA--[protein]-cysteine S-methyltransferase [Thalassobacillus sp. CUG 92003]